MTPLAVGIVCYPSLGGSGVVAVELAGGLVERGHRVHVLATAPPSRPLRDDDRLHFHEVAVADYPLFEHPPYALAAAAAIVDVAGEHRLDVVHVHYAVPHAAAAYLARAVLGTAAPRIVTTLHGTDVTSVGAAASYRTITRFTVAASDAVTVPSEYLRREARQRLGLGDGTAIDVVPNFVDTAHFSPAAAPDRGHFAALFPASSDAGGPVLFHVSNFRPVKRVTDLVATLARIRATTPARLVLVGDGPERALAAEHARALGVADAVCFLGQRTDFVQHLRHADGFLLTSESESFGVAALEALGAGVPVFAYAVGGLPEVVPPGGGRLVPPGDVDALAAAVVALLGDPPAHAAARRLAREHAVARFRREIAIARYEALYRRVCARGAGGDGGA